MLKQLKIDLKLYEEDYIGFPVLLSCFFLAGFGLLCLIMFTVNNDGSWVTMGTFGTVFSLILYSVLTFYQYDKQFRLALSMGRTRKGFLFSYAVRSLLSLTLGYALVLALYRVELALGARLFPGQMLEVDPTFLMDWKFIAVLLPSVVIFSMFLGSLYSYFGKKAMAPLWFVWMAVCLMGPQLDSGKLAVVERILAAVPGWGWIVLGLAVLAAMVGTVIGLGKKQMVK